MNQRSVVLLSSIACASLMAAACGGAAEHPPRAPESRMERESDPATIEEAQARIESARASLGAGASFSGPGTGAPSPATPPTSDAAPTDQPAKSPEPPKASSKKTSTDANESIQRSEDRCASPCRALVSMRRAVAALCRMTGDGDARCVDARKTLADSEGRVSPCSC